MSSPLSLQIKCSVCLSDFTDPVTLSCEHSFCRQCITGHMQASLGPSACPECKKPYRKEDLKPSRLLRNITSTVREHLSAESKAERGLKVPELELVCSEHDEKLKLFCETDQKLVCVICRDGDKHQGHSFKPAKEAAEINKRKLESALDFLVEENRQLDYMTKQQTTEITKTEGKTKLLLAQISAQFEEMHQFLQQKEKEVKKLLEKEEKKMTEIMQKNHTVIDMRFKESKGQEDLLQSALKIKQPDQFLQWWDEKGFPMTEAMKHKNTRGPNINYISKLKDLTVVPDSLFFGLHETHLQFIVWKEMLGSIKPVPERLTLSKNPKESYLKLSLGGARVRQVDRVSRLFKNYNPGAVSVENFQSGQHYWEVEVGDKPDWTVGIMMGEVKQKTKSAESEILLHLQHNKGCVLSCDGQDTPLNTRDEPRKIGLYLDCERKHVSFYNAGNMSLLAQRNYILKKPCCISLVPGLYLDGENSDPLTIITYESDTGKP